MLPTSALADMFPVVMTPSHDGKYFHNYTLSLLNLVSSAAQQGLSLQVSLQRGESLITRARNNAVANFLANPQWTHLFWIDSDIGFSPQAVYRLLLSDYDVACGVYPLKHENWPQEGLPQGTTQAQFEAGYNHYTVNTGAAKDNGEVHLHIGTDGFFEVDEAPTGFMLIKRQFQPFPSGQQALSGQFCRFFEHQYCGGGGGALGQPNVVARQRIFAAE
jgi:hypothetical protein